MQTIKNCRVFRHLRSHVVSSVSFSQPKATSLRILNLAKFGPLPLVKHLLRIPGGVQSRKTAGSSSRRNLLGYRKPRAVKSRRTARNTYLPVSGASERVKERDTYEEQRFAESQKPLTFASHESGECVSLNSVLVQGRCTREYYTHSLSFSLSPCGWV
jgi:hypothetical protein